MLCRQSSMVNSSLAKVWRELAARRMYSTRVRLEKGIMIITNQFLPIPTH